MVLLPTADSKKLVFLLEPNDMARDSNELLILKARTVKGVHDVTFSDELCLVHITMMGRGPLQCEQAIAKVFE